VRAAASKQAEGYHALCWLGTNPQKSKNNEPSTTSSVAIRAKFLAILRRIKIPCDVRGREAEFLASIPRPSPPTTRAKGNHRPATIDSDSVLVSFKGAERKKRMRRATGSPCQRTRLIQPKPHDRLLPQNEFILTLHQKHPGAKTGEEKG